MGLECYRIGDLVLNAGTQEVKRDETVVPLPRLSFKLLLALARHAPNVVSTRQLEAEVWEGLVVDRGTVNKRVVLLRKALGDGQDGDSYIAVIRGSGYRLLAPVERIDCSSEEVIAREVTQQDRAQAKTRTRRYLTFGLIGVFAALAVFHGTLMTISKFREQDAAGPPVMDVQVPAVASENSIAVLPFVDMTDDQTHQYLGDGIAEEVINLLSRMHGLEVAARTSSFAFRDTGLTAVEIAPRLRVSKILEGSIRHAGDTVRVTAQLIDVQTGYHVWSQSYDRSLDELFEVQDEIAVSIAESLKFSLQQAVRAAGPVTTTDYEAFELYLRGKELFNNRIELRADGLNRALDFFSRAIDKDPDFARAHAGLALAWWVLPSYDETVDEDACYRHAEASANYALEIDPGSVDAMAALASVHAARGDYEKAFVQFLQIRDIGTNESHIVHWEAMLHLRLGYFEELIGPLSRMYRLDPLNEHIGWALASALNFAGDPGAAAAVLEGLQHFAYRDYSLGLCALNAGDFERARELLRGVRMRSGILPARYANLVVDALEDPSLVHAAVVEILSSVGTGELGELVAFEALLLAGSPAAFDLEIDPIRDIDKKQLHAQVWNNWGVALRQDPRFRDWLTRLGYVELWSKHGWPDRCKPTGGGSFECI